MICANPDLVVMHGTKLVLCAGASADGMRTRAAECAGMASRTVRFTIAASHSSASPINRGFSRSVTASNRHCRRHSRGPRQLVYHRRNSCRGIRGRERRAPDLARIDTALAAGPYQPVAIVRSSAGNDQGRIVGTAQISRDPPGAGSCRVVQCRNRDHAWSRLPSGVSTE